MTIEEAIKTAIVYEKKVHATYAAAAKRAEDATAKKVFLTLAEEEQGHVTYLESRLMEWQKEGQLRARSCAPSCLPPSGSRPASSGSLSGGPAQGEPLGGTRLSGARRLPLKMKPRPSISAW